YVKESDELMEQLRADAKEALERCCSNGVTEWGAIKNELRDAVYSTVYKRTKRTPMILPMLMELD
ncbi:MAG: ribonuclease J, partial [Clostridia bacterium]|nr:ribonuclease J [Clostridia bacterium]